MAQQTHPLLKSPEQSTSTAASSKPATLPQGIEVFRSGNLIDSSGKSWLFTQKELQEIAESYDPAIHEAPIIIGHAEERSPAFGWVKSIPEENNVLTIDHHQVQPEFAEMVKEGLFKKRSISVYPPTHPSNPHPGKWSLRHVAFLGAEPPAVKGLADIQFKNSAEGCIDFVIDAPLTPPNFSEKGNTMADQGNQPTPIPTPGPSAESVYQARIQELQEKVTKLEGDLNAAKGENDQKDQTIASLQARLEALDKAQEQQAEAEIAEFCEGLIKEGRLLPANRAATVTMLNTLRKAEPVNFSENGKTVTIDQFGEMKKQLKNAAKIVNFNELSGDASVTAVPVTDEELDKMAKEYMAAHPDVTYAEALKAVKSGASA